MIILDVLLTISEQTIWDLTKPDIGFWERRAMDAVRALALCIVVFAIGAIWGFISNRVKQRQKNV